GIVYLDGRTVDLLRHDAPTLRFRTPTRRPEDVHPPVAPAPGMPHVAGDVPEDVYVRPKRIPAPERLRDPVDRFLLLRLERAEEAVPDDEDAAMVLVQVLRIHAVVDPVVRRRVQHPLREASQLPDRARVDPELV